MDEFERWWPEIRSSIARRLGVDEARVDELLSEELQSLDIVEVIMGAEDKLGIKIGDANDEPPEGGQGVREPRRPPPVVPREGAARLIEPDPELG